MKHPVLLLTLLTSLLLVHAQDAVPLPPPPPAEGVFFELALPAPPPALFEKDVVFEAPLASPRAEVFFKAATEPAPAHNHAFFFAQARPDENRDLNNQRSSPVPRPPGSGTSGERGDLPGYGSGGRSSYSLSGSSLKRVDSHGRSARPVIVTSKPLDAKELTAAEEDLGIMARLLEKEIEREAGVGGPPNSLGIYITRLDGRGPSVMLLEGYGAVFTFNVRMPLTPPPARTTEKKTERPPDSPWERTRRELFGPPGGGGEGDPGRRVGAGMMGSGGGFGGEAWSVRSDHVEYDAKKVEELKKSILEALKQAGNIRALKADDYLTVVVQGGGSGGFGPMEIAMEKLGVETRTVTGSGGGAPHLETFVKHSGDSPRSGTLTVRAKKSDAEDFAKGKLNAEQFAKKALVNIH